MELVLRPCTVHVVFFVILCWCVIDCIATANISKFLCDIAQAFYYVQCLTRISISGINCGRSVATQGNFCTARFVS